MGVSLERGYRTLVVQNLYSKMVVKMIKMGKKMQNWKIGSQVAKTGKKLKKKLK